MIIKEIVLDNFRIYKGKNTINLEPSGDKNIIIVSGNNGFGKTTFLMSLVWCLYGKQMDKVDALYRTEIEEKGGYNKYIGNSLNFSARNEGQTKFSVSITFSEVDLPDIPCSEITITRSYDCLVGVGDELEILIDGKKNELFSGTREEILKEEEIFIRDYILPIEIAKFFFFDAEKIVSFAQINTPDQRQQLSKAYSQVLGIQKYEDLKAELENIKDDFRRESAKPEDKKNFNELAQNITANEEAIVSKEEDNERLKEDLAYHKYESSNLQERLVREGQTMSLEQLQEYNTKREELENNKKNYEEGLKELYNYIPFGLAGELVSEVAEQLQSEKRLNESKHQQEGIEDKTDIILNEIDEARQIKSFAVDYKIRNFYEEQIRILIKKHFYSDSIIEDIEDVTPIHNFSEVQTNDFSKLISKVKESKSKFHQLYDNYNKAKNELFAIERKIRDAERNAESEHVQSLRKQKAETDDKIQSIIYQMAENNAEIERLKADITKDKKQKEILSKKIEVSNTNKAVDDEADNLIRLIQHFLIQFKDEKKKALAKKLEEKLKRLLHKDNLVNSVIVDIGKGDDVDINLLDFNNKIIDKGNLSMGERQMFASALLSSLVDETEIDFPVFIDSPMQKFDSLHTKNILTQFYPTVAKQVILFPLLNKELTEEEYQLIIGKTNKTYLIHNSNNGSGFVKVSPENLFVEYNTNNYAD